MYFRDHVDEVMTNRLNKRTENDLPDSLVDVDFQLLQPVLEVVYAKVLRKTKIEGYSDHDLLSFMQLKTYQLLRREKFHFDRSPYSFFYVAQTNLIRDLIRLKNRSIANGYDIDILDTVLDVHLDCDKVILGFSVM